jgi:2'-5' RNA ligase
MPRMIRTFICLDLSESLKSRLEKLELELQKASVTRVSWVKTKNLHLTLKFLGDIVETDIPKIKTSIEEIALSTKSFTLESSEIGAFPNFRRPKIFWVGIKDPTVTLLTMQQKLEQVLVSKGFAPSEKNFSPHLTIGRVKEGTGQDIVSKINKIEFLPESFPVKDIILMRSDLGPTEAVYSKLAVIKLND